MHWRRHEWNRSFEWHVPDGPYRIITPEQARAYDDQGFFVLPDAFDADTVARVTAEIDPMEEQFEAALRSQPNGRVFIARADEITFTIHLVLRSPVLRAFCGHAVFQSLAHDLIGPDVRLYWDQAVYKKPGTTQPFPWHQDNGYTYLEPQQYLTCWVALSDADESNGCPWVVPGVHRLGTLEHRLTDLGFVCTKEQPAGAVPVPVRAGGIVVFSSLTPHATGANVTDDVRKTYIVQFAPAGAAVQLAGVSERSPGQPANDPDRQFPVLIDGAPA